MRDRAAQELPAAARGRRGATAGWGAAVNSWMRGRHLAQLDAGRSRAQLAFWGAAVHSWMQKGRAGGAGTQAGVGKGGYGTEGWSEHCRGGHRRCLGTSGADVVQLVAVGCHTSDAAHSCSIQGWSTSGWQQSWQLLHIWHCAHLAAHAAVGPGHLRWLLKLLQLLRACVHLLGARGWCQRLCSSGVRPGGSGRN